MTKIAMIGAGSTVFMKNLIGDILHEPLLRDCEIALMDIDERRLATSKIVAERIAETLDARPRISATTNRRAALKGADYVVLMIQVAGYKPGTVIDFEVPKNPRPAPDHRRYARHRRHHARPQDRAGPDRGRPRHGRARPGALMLQYVNPMAINCAALGACRARGAHRRPLPFRPGHRQGAGARHRRADRGDPLSLRRHQPHGVLPDLRTPPPRRHGRGSLSAHPQGDRRRPRAGVESGALRGLQAFRLFRHRVLRALRRICALVHQARPAGPGRAVQHPARRIYPPLRGADRPLGDAGEGHDLGQVRSRSCAATNTPPRSSWRN